jgi:6,7-dimethyl-8-ribityllumazine synthase
MSSRKKNLSIFKQGEIPSGNSMRIGIVVSEWNPEITEALFAGVFATLVANGVNRKNIFRVTVPGSFELPFGAQLCLKKKRCDAVICIGCVIRGETPHFDYICQSVSKGIMDLNLMSGIPVIFGVLTCNTPAQAKARSGGKYGNKGVEAAVTALKMSALKNNYQ